MLVALGKTETRDLLDLVMISEVVIFQAALALFRTVPHRFVARHLCILGSNRTVRSSKTEAPFLVHTEVPAPLALHAQFMDSLKTLQFRI